MMDLMAAAADGRRRIQASEDPGNNGWFSEGSAPAPDRQDVSQNVQVRRTRTTSNKCQREGLKSLPGIQLARDPVALKTCIDKRQGGFQSLI